MVGNLRRRKKQYKFHLSNIRNEIFVRQFSSPDSVSLRWQKNKFYPVKQRLINQILLKIQKCKEKSQRGLLLQLFILLKLWINIYQQEKFKKESLRLNMSQDTVVTVQLISKHLHKWHLIIIIMTGWPTVTLVSSLIWTEILQYDNISHSSIHV